MKCLVALLSVVFALAACGNKGPLVMADPAAKDAALPVVAPATEPDVAEPAAKFEPAPTAPVPGTNGTPAR